MVKPLGAQAQTPADVFLRLAKVAGEDILVGGQTLAMWVEHYGVAAPEGVSAISRDVDFLATRASQERRCRVRCAVACFGDRERERQAQTTVPTRCSADARWCGSARSPWPEWFSCGRDWTR